MKKSNNSIESTTRLRRLKALLAKHNYLAEVRYSSVADSYTIVIPGTYKTFECRCTFSPTKGLMTATSEEIEDPYLCPEYGFTLLTLGYAANCMALIGYDIHLARHTIDGVEVDKFPTRPIQDPDEKEKADGLKELIFKIEESNRLSIAQEAGILEGYLAIRNFFEDSTDDK